MKSFGRRVAVSRLKVTLRDKGGEPGQGGLLQKLNFSVPWEPNNGDKTSKDPSHKSYGPSINKTPNS